MFLFVSLFLLYIVALFFAFFQLSTNMYYRNAYSSNHLSKLQKLYTCRKLTFNFFFFFLSVRAITYIDVFSLSKNDLEEVLSTNNLPTIAPRVRLFAIQTAFTKGLSEYAKGIFKPHRASHARTPRADKQSNNQFHQQQKQPNNNQNPEQQSDVVGDAEREIAMSQSAQTPIQRKVTSPDVRNSPGRLSNTNTPGTNNNSSFNSSSNGKVKRISTSAAGSASKVLQLMAERHDHMADSNQKCMDAIAKAHMDSKKKLDSLTKILEKQQQSFKFYGKIFGSLFALVLILSGVLLWGVLK